MSEAGGRGFPVVVSSPSGGGKTTIAERLLSRLPDLARSRSTTTRPPRPGEAPGREYDFVDEEVFDRLAGEGAFAEHARVHGHRYGTRRTFVESRCAEGKCPLLVIDVQGGLAIRAAWERSVLVFVMPHDLEELARRLRARETESETAVKTRMSNARREIAEALRYDYVIVNEDVDRAVEQASRILELERNAA